jgi:hypothetical protein
MSVDQVSVIDIVSKDKEGQIVLTISDHLDWNNTREHLFMLQEKINTYLGFIESGELYEKYPEAKGRQIRIDIKFHYQPTLEASAFLDKIKPIVEAGGNGFSFELFSATPFPI